MNSPSPTEDDNSTAKRSSPIGAAMLDTEDRLELMLVRHGQQFDVLERDSPLSAVGRQQAAAVGEYLAGFEIDAVWSSHLSRAHDTGLAIAAHHNFDCQVDQDLREIELGQGVPDNKSIRDIYSEDELRNHGTAFLASRRWESFPMSETGEQLRARVMPVIGALIEKHRTGRVVIACHGGVINAIVGAQIAVESDYFFRAAHCSIHRIWASPERTALQSLNETHHLPPHLVTH